MSISDELQRLEELRAAGTLSEGEFEQAKQQVLAGESRRSKSLFTDGKIAGIAEPTWCTLMHLSQLLLFAAGIGIVAPIVMWAVSKDESELARRHGNRMMNWLISSLIYKALFGVLVLWLIGFPLLIVLLLLDIVFPIRAGLKANDGELWSYPLAIRFLRED